MKLNTLKLLIVSSILVFSYQNCSDIHFQSHETSDVGCGVGCTLTGSAEFTVPTKDLPQLKMFFIVDNSYTMYANQIKLAESFNKMFEGSHGGNLTPFDTTAYIINTSQRVYPFQSSKLTQLRNSLNGERWRDDGLLSGAMPGDTVGYNISIDSTGRWNFLPAFVLGLADRPDERVAPVLKTLSRESASYQEDSGLAAAMHKPAEISADYLKQQFQSRVAVLNPNLNPYQFSEVLDNESGLCALSRVLNQNENFVKPGDLAAFVIVSDENDSDPQGLNCVNSYAQHNGDQDLIAGRCETRRTQFTYNVPVPVPATCKVTYNDGYNVAYTYPTTKKQTTITYRKVDKQTHTVPRTKITYYKEQSSSFSAPRVKVTYHKKLSQAYKRTKINYFVKSCPVRDGVVVESLCNFVAKTKTVDGDVIANCSEAALAADSKALISGNNAPTCVADSPATRSCSLTDSNCITTWQTPLAQSHTYGDISKCQELAAQLPGAVVDTARPASCEVAENEVGNGQCPANASGCTVSKNIAQTTAEVDGSFNPQQCLIKAASLSKAIVNDQHPAVCEQVPAVTREGSCPSSAGKDCVTNRTYIQAESKVDGDFSQAQACLDQAKKLNGQAVDGQNLPVCVTGDVDTTRTIDVFVAFDSQIPNQTSNSVCSDSVLAQVLSANTTLPTDGTCKIKSLRAKTNDISNFANACTQKASELCSQSSGEKRNCTHKETAARTDYVNKNFVPREEHLLCSDLCSKSVTGVCDALPNVSVDKSTTTIEQYFASAYGSTKCQHSHVATGHTKFIDKLLSEKDEVCKPQNGKPTYVVVEENYRANYLVTDFVSGTVHDKKNERLVAHAPQKKLASYIHDRSQQLFGSGLKPIVNVFVRKSNDNMGSGGSAGAAYEELADLMGGKKETVLTDDYSPALISLSKTIKEKLERSFTIHKMRSFQSVKKAFFKKKDTHSWVELDDEFWTVSGKTVTISPDFDFDLGDMFKFDYY